MTAPTDTEKLLPIREAAKLVPCHFDVIKRWIHKGIRQRRTGKIVKLESTYWLQRRCVSLEAIERFKKAIQAPVIDEDDSEEVETPAQRLRRSAETKATLRAHGLKV